jgi:hypothetical protein
MVETLVRSSLHTSILIQRSDMAEYQQYLDFAIDLAKKVSEGSILRVICELTSTFFVKAGEMIKEGQAKRFSDDSSLDTKANAIDVSLRVLG